MDETYVKVKGQWKYLYRAVDKQGKTVDLLLRAYRDKAAARRYLEKAIDRNGEPCELSPSRSQTVLGIKAPGSFRRLGAASFSAYRRQ